LTEGQMASLKAIVLRGPDPAVDRVRRWRIVDLCRVVEERWGVSTARPGCCVSCGRSICRTARPARFIRKPMRRRKTTSKKGVRRAPERDRPRPPRSRALRNLEPGRGAGRAEGPHRLYLVAARPYAARAARPRPPLGLDHRRGVPRARHRCGAGDDPARHRRDEPLPRRIGTGQSRPARTPSC